MIKSVKDIIKARSRIKTAGNIAYEFQDFGVRLAQSLNDLGRKSFYIKLSKEVDRATLERARDFAVGYEKAKSKAKVFMWFLKQARGPVKLQAPKNIKLQTSTKSDEITTSKIRIPRGL